MNKITIEFAASICYAGLPLKPETTRTKTVRQFNQIAERERARTEHGRAVAEMQETMNGEQKP